MNFLRKLWQGKYALPVAFWGFYCAGLIACVFLAGLIMVIGRLFSLGGLVDARPIAIAIGLALSYSYLLIATVGVWRSAGPYWASPIWISRIWAAAARLLVVGWIANVGFNLADGGAVAITQWIAGDFDF